MAVLAWNVHVLAGERKVRFAVIETRVLPVLVGMTIGAGIAQFALVFVVLAMAGDAVGWRVTKFLSLCVTVATLHLGHGMTTLEREVGELVVKGLLIERRDVHATSLVLGVADATFLFRDTSMISLLLYSILRDFLVTIEAQAALRAFPEAHVTLLAITLEFGMALYHLAWHDQVLDRVSQ